MTEAVTETVTEAVTETVTETVTEAVGYLRVSGKDQITGDGFPRQRAAIAAYAKANGIKVVRYFEEKGVSGATEWDSRPAWVDMCASLNGVRTIIIERLDRLARDYGIQEWVIRDLRKRGVTLLSTAEPDLASDDPTRVLFRQILGSISQYDKTMIVLKLRGARHRMKAREGRCEGRKPYGDREGERAVIERMKELRETVTLAEVAGVLNAEGYPTRRGGPWIAATVSKMALNIVNKYDPQVTRVVDGKSNVKIIVTDDDCKKGKANDPNNCALVKALDRDFDGAIVSKSIAYLIRGHTAYRFRVPSAIRTEIVSFDRNHDFRPGEYKLNAPCTTEKLEYGREKLEKRVPAKKGTTIKRKHKVEGVRAL